MSSLAISNFDRVYDVIILGGGPSGAMAGIAAARLGAKSLVVEQHGFMGGSLTAMGVGPMMSFHNPAGTQVVKGIPEELIQRLMSKGASPGHVPDSVTYCSTVTPFNSELLKIELETMLAEAGGSVLYHTQLAGVESGDNGKVEAVVLCNKAGLTRYCSRIFIDASGDADLAARSGVPFQKGRTEDGAMQPMTMNLKIGNVDTHAVREDVYSNPDDFEFTLGRKEGLKRLRATPRISLKGYFKSWDEARVRGEVTVPREGVLLFETSDPGVFIVNTSRIQGLDATDPYQLSQAEMIGRSQCIEIFNFLKRYCRGFENAIRMDASPQIGVRETRHIKGLYTITAEDIVNQTPFLDPIAVGGYPIDIHSPEEAETVTTHLLANTRYQIPMRALLNDIADNLIVAGRAISATHEAMAAFRVTPIAMAIGQGAGTLAALAAMQNVPPADIDYNTVREKLSQHGAVLS